MKEIIKSYKFRIYPNKNQKTLIHKTFGCTRFVYNFAKAWQKREEDMWITVKQMQDLGYPFQDYKSKYFKKYESIGFIPELKKNYPWLKEVDNTALQNSIKRLDSAYSRYYKKQGGKPKFKSKKNPIQSYTSNCNYDKKGHSSIAIIGNYIKLPKIGAIKFRDKSRPEGKIQTATVSYEAGKYYVSLSCKEVYIEEFSKTNQNIGIDLGIVDFAILSNGDKIPNHRFYEKQLNKLARLHKELSRKQKDSKNRKKAKIKLGKLYQKISNQRKDFLNKLTTNLVKQYDIICIEDLNVSAMKETDNSKRNMRVSDVSWYEFKRQLAYKCEWYGKKLSIVDRYFPSSQICSCCGKRDKKKDVSIREWICPNYGAKLDRDINASINILNEGLRILE